MGGEFYYVVIHEGDASLQSLSHGHAIHFGETVIGEVTSGVSKEHPVSKITHPLVRQEGQQIVVKDGFGPLPPVAIEKQLSLLK